MNKPLKRELTMTKPKGCGQVAGKEDESRQ